MKKILPFIRSSLFKLLSVVGLNTPTRIVIFLSPIFVALAGTVVALAGKYIPYLPSFDKAQVANLFEIGAAAMAVKLLLWLHGAQKLEPINLAAQPGLFISNSPVEHTHTFTNSVPEVDVVPAPRTTVADAISTPSLAPVPEAGAEVAPTV